MVPVTISAGARSRFHPPGSHHAHVGQCPSPTYPHLTRHHVTMPATHRPYACPILSTCRPYEPRRACWSPRAAGALTRSHPPRRFLTPTHSWACQGQGSASSCCARGLAVPCRSAVRLLPYAHCHLAAAQCKCRQCRIPRMPETCASASGCRGSWHSPTAPGWAPLLQTSPTCPRWSQDRSARQVPAVPLLSPLLPAGDWSAFKTFPFPAPGDDTPALPHATSQPIYIRPPQ